MTPRGEMTDRAIECADAVTGIIEEYLERNV